MFKESVDRIIKVIVVGDVQPSPHKLASGLPRNIEVLSFGNGEKTLTFLRNQEKVTLDRIGIIICEQIQEEGMLGTNLLECSISLAPSVKRILLIDYSQLDIDAIQRSQLFRFITKPYKMEKLISTIRRALEEFVKEQQPLRFETEIVGRDPGFLNVLGLVRRVSDSPAPVLIRGETGTGKELIARALHFNGPGQEKPYVVVNCCALPETLFEAEMFGHKKGSFTGAYQDRKGRVAKAEGGTLFIDEVAEIPLPVQAKLLRFLQFGEFQPVGSDSIEKANVRIVAATNVNLEKKIEEGVFRKDLYYRLKVLDVVLPPLRKRISDIHLLAGTFIEKYWERPGTPNLSDQALKVLEFYHYPGNVRELENVIQRACLLARTEEIDLDALPPELIKKTQGDTGILTADKLFPRLDNESLKRARIKAGTEARNRVERKFLKQLLTQFDSISSAATHAGMQRTYLHTLITKHGLSHPK